jgi:aspartyl-tRNA(Asn)/glutamyl-tRNA(Gln) amidotransferase subunit A
MKTLNEMSHPSTDLTALPAHVLGQEIVAGRLSPVDVVDALLARIDRLEPKLQAFTAVYADEARLAAEAAHKAIRSGHALGPLHGVPVALKDLIDLEGRITMGGSAAQRQRRSTVTATIAKKMIAQGMIVLGKTHTVENPWDMQVPRTPGGSSSGSGVAVAAHMAPWAIGTDTGGSVRLPASFCGLTGLKVTVGRVSTYGIIPLSHTLDTPGPMARDVADVAILFNVIEGMDPLDPLTRGLPATNVLADLNRGVRGLRLARMPASEREGVSAEMLAAYDASLDLLASQGAEIVDIVLPFTFTDCVTSSAISQAEAYFYNGHLADDPASPLGDAVRARVLGGANISAQDYIAARGRHAAWKAAMHAAMEGIDALLTPTTMSAAIPLDSVDEDQVPSRFTRFGNLLEMCALALPNGFTPSGLPLSLQICCRGYEEAMALRIGHAYQSATDWHLRAPAL